MRGPALQVADRGGRVSLWSIPKGEIAWSCVYDFENTPPARSAVATSTPSGLKASAVIQSV